MQAAPPAATARPIGKWWFLAPEDGGEVVGKGPFPASTSPSLLEPALAVDSAPAKFRISLRTSAGNFAVDCHRAWAPNGADRLYNLVKIGFFDDVAFFRVVLKPRPFVAQFGIHGDPKVAAAWREKRIAPDPVVQSNTRGTLTFAMAETADTRTTQLFFNLADNVSLDAMGFAPVCVAVEGGLPVIDKLFGGYGEAPSQDQIQKKGNAYLREKHPELDYIATARVVSPTGAVATPAAPPMPNAGEVVGSMAADFRGCYNAGLAEDPAMQGTVRITAKIGPGGEVTSTSVSGGGTLSKGVLACLEARVQRAQFAPPEGGGATLVIPITFKPQQ